MKIAVLGTPTHASVEQFLVSAFQELGHECIGYDAWNPPQEWLSYKYWKFILSAPQLRHDVRKIYLKYLNDVTLNFLLNYKPDAVITHNDAKLLPSTIQTVRKKLNIPFATLVGDDPTIAIYLPEYLPLIPHFTHVFAPESYLVKKLRTFTTKVAYLPFGTDPGTFYPDKGSNKDDEKLDIGYVSNSYNAAPYGMYRALFLVHLREMGLTIYGDRGWKHIYYYVPELKNNVSITGYLDSQQMNDFYNRIKICVNIPNPQIVTGIAQRILDAAAAECFQVTIYKKDLVDVFSDSIATFEGIDEMIGKTRYFLDHPEERRQKAKCAREIVLKAFKWQQIAAEALELMG